MVNDDGIDLVALMPLVERQYDASIVDLRLLSPRWGRRIYRVERRSAPSWVMRIYPPSFRGEALTSHTTTLRFLEQRGYPAPRLIQTRDGQVVVPFGDRRIVVTSFVAGEQLDGSPASLSLLAAAVGRLHTIDTSEQPEGLEAALSATHWTPERQIPRVLQRLQRTPPQAQSKLSRRYDAVLSALQQLGKCADIPVTLVHTDPVVGNAVRVAAEQAVLVDWDDAGLGPAMTDLGYLLIAHDGELAPTDRRPSAGHIAAAVDGYCRQRIPTPAELAALPDAIRFTPAVNAALALLDLLAGRDEEADWQRWWGRYLAAEETAALALDRRLTGPHQ